MDIQTPHRNLVTLRGLARRLRPLGVTRKWLEAEADAGRLPHLRVGRQTLFNAEAVEKVLADRAAKGGAA